MENNNLLPLTAIFIEPAKVLFLNNRSVGDTNTLWYGSC